MYNLWSLLAVHKSIDQQSQSFLASHLSPQTAGPIMRSPPVAISDGIMEPPEPFSFENQFCRHQDVLHKQETPKRKIV